MVGRLSIHLAQAGEPIPVGQMQWDASRRAVAFEWDSSFQTRGLILSPFKYKRQTGLSYGPDAPFDGLHGLFADSLPDSWGRLLLDRELSKSGRSPSTLNPVDRLAYVGQHGMGALTYQPVVETEDISDIDLAWFAKTSFDIEGEASVEDLRQLRNAAGGSGGARPKFSALLNPQTSTLRDHRGTATPGFEHYLIKYRHSAESKSVAVEEHAYALMAKDAGITMPETMVLESAKGDQFFAIKRFDRAGDNRSHIHTVAGMMEVSHHEMALDYENLLKLVRHITNHFDDLEQMFRRMVFNVFTHNRDDHVKNHSFVMTDPGEWRLSPAYDLTFSDGPGGEHNLPVNGNGRNPTADDLKAVGERVGIKPKRCGEIIDQVSAAVVAWSIHADTAGVPPRRRNLIRNEIEAVSGLNLAR